MNADRTRPGSAASAEAIRPGSWEKNVAAWDRNEEIADRAELNALVKAARIREPRDASAL